MIYLLKMMIYLLKTMIYLFKNDDLPKKMMIYLLKMMIFHMGYTCYFSFHTCPRFDQKRDAETRDLPAVRRSRLSSLCIDFFAQPRYLHLLRWAMELVTLW